MCKVITLPLLILCTVPIRLHSEPPACVSLLFTLLCRLVCSSDIGGMEEKVKKKKKNMLRDGKDSGQGAVEEMRRSEEELVV